MRRIYLTIISLLILTGAFAQKIELGLSFNSGLFSFAGKSAEKSSFIYAATFANQTTANYTNNPYGSKNGLGYGLSFNMKRIGRKHIIIGADAGYERLRSRTGITQVNGQAANGNTFLNYDFINLFPHLGYRLHAAEVAVDITAGFDVAFCLSTREKGEATANNIKYTTDVDRKTIKSDARPRVQLSALYHRIGIYMGYSAGLANYKKGYAGGVNECYARLIRFGITCRLR